jgi:hypothetical protein
MARRGRPRQNALPPNLYPRRTREHIISHLSVRAVQWLAAKCGFIAEAPEHDYGYDLYLYTFDAEGRPEFGTVAIQLKATDNLQPYRLADNSGMAFPVEQRHLQYWKDNFLPVIFILYDAANQAGYWLYVQRYLHEIDFVADPNQTFVTLRVPLKNVLNEAAIQEFRRYKELVRGRMAEVVHHGENGR